MMGKRGLISCPACDFKKSFTDFCPASFLRGDERWIKKCSQCGLSVLWPLPQGRELNTFYDQGYYNFNRSLEEGKGFYFARLLSRMAEKGRFLDIGCATGFFMNGIQQNCNWEVFGQETGKKAAAYAREKMGLAVKDVSLEKARYPGNFFDFIHLNNVLEHVVDPAKVMIEVGRILKPGGRLYLAVPNGGIDRLGYLKYHLRFGERGASMDGHLYFFTPSSLTLLASKAGLRIEKFYSCGLKRALRILGYWPRKRDWQKAYQGRELGENLVEKAVTQGRGYPKLYYLWKHTEENLLRFPGFLPWTYDFNLYLTK